jgi:hypothetical protein
VFKEHISRPTESWEMLLEEHYALEPINGEVSPGCTLENIKQEIRALTERENECDRARLQLAQVYDRIHRSANNAVGEKRGMKALCLSGGGIRSATLNLGLLQGLARQDELKTFDYLSTVSGGGFVGAFLSAWIHRVPRGAISVDELLDAGPRSAASPGGGTASTGLGQPDLLSEPAEVSYLREYSNYLTPRLGFFSSDTWSLIAIYPRNLLLNWLVLLPLLVSMILFVWGFVIIGLKLAEDPSFYDPFFYSGLTLFLTGIAFAVSLSPQAISSNRAAPSPEVAAPQRWLPRVLVTFPLCIGVLILTLITPKIAENLRTQESPWMPYSIILNLILAGIATVARSMVGLSRNSPFRVHLLAFLKFAFIINAATVPSLLLLRVLITHLGPDLLWVFGVAPLIRILVLFVLFSLVVGLTSEVRSPEYESSREWWARIMGILFRFGVIYALGYGCVVLVPTLVFRHWHFYIPAGIGVTGAIAGLVALLSGASSRVGAIRDINPRLRRRILEALPAVCAVVFILLSFMGTSMLLSAPLPYFEFLRDARLGLPPPTWADTLTLSVLVPVVLLAMSIVLALPINVNHFSLHGTYRTRLIRAYLGASRGKARLPNPFTGFDPNDNLPLHFLRRNKAIIDHDLIDAQAIAQLLTGGDSEFFRRVRSHSPLSDDLTRNQLKDYAKSAGVPINNLDCRRTIIHVLNYVLEDRDLYDFAFTDSSTPDEAIALAHRQIENDGSVQLRNRLILEAKLRGADGKAFLRGEIVKPFHVINATLNLVGGERLAWQQRKAKSFVFTPLYSGFDGGYRPSVIYGGGVTLGGAMTCSGAAASPNMGYHSSGPVTFLMTLFNIRLGCWLGNPAFVEARGIYSELREWFADFPLLRMKPTYELPSPRYSFRTFLDEGLGRTTESNPYVYLSDGGHFDNLGLYEMIRRRCRQIVVSDVSCDSVRKFTDLGNAIQKIRVDLGVPITLLQEYTQKLEKRNIRILIFDIEYRSVDDMESAQNGVLIYLKAALDGTEPPDIFTYHKESKTFPHESTTDQWFSEAQFESYRQLGELMAYEMIKHLNDRNSAAAQQKRA